MPRHQRFSRLAVCSWSLRPGDSAELVRSIQDLGRGEGGLSAVQLALVPLVERPERWADALSRLRDAGIEVVSGMFETVGEDYSTLESIALTGGVRPDATWPATLARATRVAELAGAAGIPLVTFHAGFIPHRGSSSALAATRGVLLERLRILADLFSSHGVRIALETGQERAETLLEALDDLDRPEVGVNFDPANLLLYGMGDPVAALRQLASRVRQIHVKDAVPSATPGAWGTEVPVGEGAVDWPTFLDLAHSIEPAVDLVIEREAGERRIEDVRHAIEFVRGAGRNAARAAIKP